MKIALIQPSMGGPNSSLVMEPLELSVLAALTPAPQDVVLYDERVESIPVNAAVDLAVINVDTFTARRSYEISQAYRGRGVPVVMIGSHVALVPQEVSRHCDSMVIGEPYEQWAQLVADLKADRLKREYRCAEGYVLPKGVFPRRELFKSKKYLPVTPVQFSRGCDHGCRHCICSTQGRSCRPVQDVVQELQQQSRKTVFFTDDNICTYPQKLKELLRQLTPLKLRWIARSSLAVLDDPELLRLMVKSGCMGLIIGFDSIEIASIRQMDKTVNLEHCRKHYAKAIRTLHKQGLQIWGEFTLGYDGDTVDSILETARFARGNPFCFAFFHTLTPLPGTELYRRLQQENRLLYEGNWWLHPQYRFGHGVFKPRNMNALELKESVLCCRVDYYRYSARVKRLWMLRTVLQTPGKLSAYHKYTRLLREDVFRQQGMALGSAATKENQ